MTEGEKLLKKYKINREKMHPKARFVAKRVVKIYRSEIKNSTNRVTKSELWLYDDHRAIKKRCLLTQSAGSRFDVYLLGKYLAFQSERGFEDQILGTNAFYSFKDLGLSLAERFKVQKIESVIQDYNSKGVKYWFQHDQFEAYFNSSWDVNKELRTARVVCLGILYSLILLLSLYSVFKGASILVFNLIIILPALGLAIYFSKNLYRSLWASSLTADNDGVSIEKSFRAKVLQTRILYEDLHDLCQGEYQGKAECLYLMRKGRVDYVAFEADQESLKELSLAFKFFLGR